MRRLERSVVEIRTEQAEVDRVLAETETKILALQQEMGKPARDLLLEIQRIQTKAMNAVGARPQVYFGGEALIGKDCTRICEGCDEYLAIIRLECNKYLDMFSAGAAREGATTDLDKQFESWGILLGVFDKFFSIVCAPRRLTDQHIIDARECVVILEREWSLLYKSTGSILPKVHLMFSDQPLHLMEFLERTRFAGLLSEDAAEGDHHVDKVDSKVTQGSMRDFTAQQLQNYKRRSLRNNPEVANEIQGAEDKTRRGEKINMKEKRDGKIKVKKEKREKKVLDARTKQQQATLPIPAPVTTNDAANMDLNSIND